MHGSYFAYGFFRGANYMFIPLGIASILLGLATLPLFSAQIEVVLLFLSQFVLIFGLIVGWRLFKPEWVKWVEKHHKDIIPYLQLEIRDRGWHVDTREELENWIKELRVKYKQYLN